MNRAKVGQIGPDCPGDHYSRLETLRNWLFERIDRQAEILSARLIAHGTVNRYGWPELDARFSAYLRRELQAIDRKWGRA